MKMGSSETSLTGLLLAGSTKSEIIYMFTSDLNLVFLH